MYTDKDVSLVLSVVTSMLQLIIRNVKYGTYELRVELELPSVQYFTLATMRMQFLFLK